MRESKANSRKPWIPRERTEQRALVQWVHLQYPNELLVHVPNGLVRSHVEAQALVLDGGVPGMPDLVLFCPKGVWHGLAIELKRTAGGVISEKQIKVIEHLNSRGYKAIVAQGWLVAKEAIEEYMKL